MYEEENWDDEIAGLSPKSAPQSLPTWTPSSSSFERGQSQSQRVWFFIHFLQNIHILIIIIMSTTNCLCLFEFDITFSFKSALLKIVNESSKRKFPAHVKMCFRVDPA
jgi:hypothetical protein